MTIINILLWIIAGLLISPILIILYIRITFWFLRKYIFLMISIKLILSKHKEVREIGWMTLKFFLWETKD